MSDYRKNPRFYVDVALVYVVVISLLAVSRPLWTWPKSVWNLNEALAGAFGLAAFFLLAKERWITLSAALAYMFFFGLVHLPTAHGSEFWILAGIVALSGAAALSITVLNSKRTEFYGDKVGLFDWIVVAIVATAGLALISKPLFRALEFYFGSSQN